MILGGLRRSPAGALSLRIQAFLTSIEDGFDPSISFGEPLTEFEAMNSALDSQRLHELFQQKKTLPAMPGAVTRLIDAIDSPNASAQVLEDIVATDPALASRIMCVANSAFAGHSTPVGSIRGAIMRLGMEAVRSIALSFMVTAVAGRDSTTRLFSPRRYSHHSVYVGVMCRYLFARLQRLKKVGGGWSSEEIMAAGVLHDVAVPLLACLAPQDFERLFLLASRENLTFDAAFNRHSEISLGELSANACEQWGLPPLFASSLRRFEEPWKADEGIEGVACIHYANFLADATGNAFTPWNSTQELSSSFPESVLVDPDEMEFAREAVDRHVAELLGNASAKAA